MMPSDSTPSADRTRWGSAARPAIVAALCAAVSLAGPVPAHSDTLERTFDTGSFGRFVLDTDVGAVGIASGAGNTVEVVVERLGSDASALEVTFDQRGDEIRVVGDLPRGQRRRRMDLDVTFRVLLPRGFAAQVSTAGGSIEVDDLAGDVDLDTAGGHIHLADMGGEVRARTAGGSISLDTAAGDAILTTAGGSIDVQRADGRVEASTAGGSITIDEAGGEVKARTAGGSIRIGSSGGNVVAHTAGGSINVEDVLGSVDASTNGGSINASLRSQPAGDSELRTSGGSITVRVAAGVALDIDAYSSNSTVQSDFDFPAGAWDDEQASLRAALNGGGPALTIRASHRIRLRRD
jgi:DUF4097 and DUF4098 domain-containing protein YvlB